jgi:fructose-1,6-bisphosphatase I
MKRLDQISKNVLQNALRFTGRLRVVEAPRGNVGSEEEEDEGPAAHQPGVTIAYALDQYGKERGDGGGSSSSSSILMSRKSRIKTGGGTSRSSSSSSSSFSSDGGGGNGTTLGKEKRLAASADAKWSKSRRLAAFFDPLDGSGNADAAIPTGTVFGVFDADAAFPRGESPNLKDTASLIRAVLQPGNNLLAAGYCMYSSTTILVFTLGGGTHGFTLDPAINEFVLTHPNMKIPKRGNIYSCNEAYSEGWNDKFKQYLKKIKTGNGETGQRYTQRYIGSMVGDVHRTLMYGGIFCCPSDTEVHHNGNLQLVYKSAPMAYILEHAGGKSTNGESNLLSVKPERVHQRSPCFMGSPEDMDELMTYMSGE